MPTLSDLFRKQRESDLSSSESDIDNISDQLSIVKNSLFSTVVVKDVISNPASFLNREYKGLKIRDALKQTASGGSLSDSQLVNFIPRNTIIGFNVSSADANSNPKPEIFFPFFPGHLSLPVKPGESVWVIYDQGNGRGYWLSRKVSFRQSEDLNYTATSRELDIARADLVTQSLGNDQDVKDALRDLVSSFTDIGNLPVSIDDIVADSVAYKEEFIGEPVPSYSKKCGDLVLQGSNNTLISLGTDRSFKSENKSLMTSLPERLSSKFAGLTSLLSDNDNVQNKENSEASFQYFKPEMAGCIELVAGRSINNFTQDDITVNARKKGNSLSFFEFKKFKSLFKDESEEDQQEGEFTLPNNSPLARFYVSMRSMPNDNHPSLIKQVLGEDPDIKKSIEDHEGVSESAIVGSAYSIKSFAKGNCEFQSEAGGSVFISDGVILASKGGAYIHLKPNGDISIVPGKNGVIKLGGEEANLTSLCSYDITKGVQTNFNPGLGEKAVKGIPLMSSALGALGVDSNLPVTPPSPTGTFATKILLK